MPAEHPDSPPLAVYRPRRGAGWLVGGVAASLVLLVFALLFGRDWLFSSAVPWLLVVAPLALIAVTALGTSVSVWTDRLFVRELWYRREIRLDQLTEVDVRANGPKLRVRMRDRTGTKMVTALDNLQAEPEVWAVLQPAVARALGSPECARNALAAQQFQR